MVVVIAAAFIITTISSYLFGAFSLVSSQPHLSFLQTPKCMCVLGLLLFFLLPEGNLIGSDLLVYHSDRSSLYPPTNINN